MASAWWSLGRRIAFRFGTLAASLLMLPFAIALVARIANSEQVFFTLIAPWHWLVGRFAEVVLGIELPPRMFTGSGDTLWNYVELLFVVVVSLAGTLVWSLLDRRRTAYPRLASAMTVALRYFLAIVLVGYGMAKVLPMQFPPLWLGRYDMSIGDMSPMGLLWTFMGYSQVYTFFAGAAEVAGALLLLWRRTYVIGAFLLAIVMTNVVILNFCYDVPVKLWSSQLLVMLLVLLLPHARRLLCAFLGRPTPEVPPRVRGTFIAERIRGTAKIVALGIIAMNIYDHYSFVDRIERVRARSVLYGVWRAERVVIDGVERPPLFTDDARWRKVVFHEYGATVRYATDRRKHYRAEIDPKTRTITLVQGIFRHVWRYQRIDDEHLVIETPNVRAELVLEPPPLLQTRGFHWIQEVPFNR